MRDSFRKVVATVPRKPTQKGKPAGSSQPPRDSRAQVQEVLDLLRSQGDGSWREGLADRHATSDVKRNAESSRLNANAIDDARLFAFFRQLQTLVHKCRTPGCGQRFGTEVELVRHQQETHTVWPKSSLMVSQAPEEEADSLNEAVADVEQEFSALLDALVPGLSEGSTDMMRLTQKLNELQDSYASRELPTASTLCAGAVQYARLLNDEATSSDGQRMSSQLRSSLAKLQHANGLGGNLGLALRSLRFRSAVMDREELEDFVQSGPEDWFWSAASARLGRIRVPREKKEVPNRLGEPMKEILMAVASGKIGVSLLEQLRAVSMADRVAIPWVKVLVEPVYEGQLEP